MLASNLVGGMAATGCFCMVASGQCDAVGALSGTTTSRVVAIAWLDSVNSDVTLLCAAFIASFDTIELRELSGTTFDFSTWKTCWFAAGRAHTANVKSFVYTDSINE